ncbi:MAG: glycosyltransferase family 4 protein [Phycisphaerae bacterium]|nr:glycosyltransferase family 4 protein [Phycisphaerae bacterium]
MSGRYIVLAVDTFEMDPARPQGHAFSCRDTLAALLSSGYPVKVITRRRSASHDWPAPGEPEWFEVRELQGWGRLGGAYNRLVRRLARTSISQLRPQLLVVEGNVSHRLIERVRDWDVPHKAIIMRGTPAQFEAKYGGAVPPQLPKVLSELRTYHTLISLSSRVADKWKVYSEVRQMNVRIIPNCGREEEASVIVNEDRAALRARLGFGPDTFVIVCVGSIQRRKGQDMLIGFLDSIGEIVPDFRLVLVGPICPEAGGDIVLRDIAAHVLRDRVQVLGARRDVLRITRAADLFVLPTREEAMPRAVLDAMVLRTPIVSTSVDGILELIESGAEGLLFDPAQPEMMIHAIRRMVEDAEFRSSCAECACRKYWAVFSRSLQMQRYKSYVSEVMT